MYTLTCGCSGVRVETWHDVCYNIFSVSTVMPNSLEASQLSCQLSYPSLPHMNTVHIIDTHNRKYRNRSIQISTHTHTYTYTSTIGLI